MTIINEDFATPAANNLQRPDTAASPVSALEKSPHRISRDLEETGDQWDRAFVADLLNKYPDGQLPEDHFLSKFVEADGRAFADPNASLMEALRNYRSSLTPLARDLDSRAFIPENSSKPEDRAIDPVQQVALDLNYGSSKQSSLPEPAAAARSGQLPAMPVAKTR